MVTSTHEGKKMLERIPPKQGFVGRPNESTGEPGAALMFKLVGPYGSNSCQHLKVRAHDLGPMSSYICFRN